MIHEIRVYTIIQGREEVEIERFEKHMPALFERHAIDCVGCWTGSAGAAGPTFVYAMAYESLAQREEHWAAFYRDADWHHVRATTQGDEECVERFDIHLVRSNAAWMPGPSTVQLDHIPGSHDLVFAEVAVGQATAANAFLQNAFLPAIGRAGGKVLLVSDCITGSRLPKLAMMFAWPDAIARNRGWRQLREDAELRDARATERRMLGRPAIGPMDLWMLDPLPFRSAGTSLNA
ncbi:NIPSNAP family protein [Rhizorhabdus argentea]|uniref:NIPSNAP family protein n=1 Tax=Rhizorhabdus argentea TaxID=1387174 RepID=UPI0030ED64C8